MEARRDLGAKQGSTEIISSHQGHRVKLIELKRDNIFGLSSFKREVLNNHR